MIEENVKRYIELSKQEIMAQLATLRARQFPQPGQRQEPFTPVETLLCYGLFQILNPHRYGGRNIDSVPSKVKTLSAFFRRSVGSITSKMLNLDGSRTNSARYEPLLFATLASQPLLYPALYTEILSLARLMGIEEDSLPDFLEYLSPETDGEYLLGQEDLPAQTGILLKGADETIQQLEKVFALDQRLTEKLAERKVRLAQHWFAREVLENCGHTCVFCGFSPHSLPGLLRASHIKPWARSTPPERVDIRNGLAACVLHDAAFDRGYLTVNGGFRIHRSPALQQSLGSDPGADRYFGDALHNILLLPEHAKRPTLHYLEYHREHIFKQ